MALPLYDRVKVATATTGTGTLTLGSAASGYRTFANAGVTDGSTVDYVIENGTDWEIGTGVYTSSGTTLSRSVLLSSNANAALNLVGSSTVYITATSRTFGDYLPLSGGTMTGALSITGNTQNMFAGYYTANNVFSGGFSVYKRGDSTSNTSSLANNSEIGYHGFYGWNGSAYNRGAFVFAVTTQAWSTANSGTKLEFYTTPNGANTNARALLLDPNGDAYFANTITSTNGFYDNGVRIASQVLQNSQSAAYTLVLSDGGKHIYHPSADTTARTWTIPANSSVAFPIGTTITFDNDYGAGVITIAITTDTLVLVGAAGSTGSRTLAAGGQATALKVASTRWRISGIGLT